MFMFWYLIFIPFVSCAIIVAMKANADMNKSRFSWQLWVFAVLLIIFLALLIICSYWLFTFWTGVSVSLIVVLSGYVIAQYIVMRKNRFRLSTGF